MERLRGGEVGGGGWGGGGGRLWWEGCGFGVTETDPSVG